MVLSHCDLVYGVNIDNVEYACGDASNWDGYKHETRNEVVEVVANGEHDRVCLEKQVGNTINELWAYYELKRK